MRHLLTATIITIALFAPHGVQAQSRLSATDVAGFKGTWVLDVGRSGAAAEERRMISLAPEWIRVDTERAGDDHPPVMIYKFDGLETKNPFGDGTAISHLDRGSKDLVLVTVYTVNGQSVTLNEILRLNPGGSELTVETTMKVEHGYQGEQPSVESNAPKVSKATSVFKKQP